MVRYVDEYFKLSSIGGTACTISERPPLFFQHAGHSRTIVGIERLKSGKINLILFDPSKSPSTRAKEYARGKVDGKKNISDALLKPFRHCSDDLAKKKEYQILR